MRVSPLAVALATLQNRTFTWRQRTLELDRRWRNCALRPATVVVCGIARGAAKSAARCGYRRLARLTAPTCAAVHALDVLFVKARVDATAKSTAHDWCRNALRRVVLGVLRVLRGCCCCGLRVVRGARLCSRERLCVLLLLLRNRRRWHTKRQRRLLRQRWRWHLLRSELSVGHLRRLGRQHRTRR